MHILSYDIHDYLKKKRKVCVFVCVCATTYRRGISKKLSDWLRACENFCAYVCNCIKVKFIKSRRAFNQLPRKYILKTYRVRCRHRQTSHIQQKQHNAAAAATCNVYRPHVRFAESNTKIVHTSKLQYKLFLSRHQLFFFFNS